VSRRRLVALSLSVGSAVLALAAAPEGVIASPLSPPFSQCPAIGADTGCGLLIDVGPNGQPTVFQDPSQGPYDGADDTLIGVVNDSLAPLSSLPLSSGTDVFAFDGDGLCTYVPEAGCPGATGYEGPGVSLTKISEDFKSGTVIFSPPLAPGQSTYFSLEEALQLVPPNNVVPGPPNGGTYVAFGDSYSAGEGLPPYVQGTDAATNHCHRSPQAYGPLLDADRSLGTLIFAACSGAVTADLGAPNHEGNNDQGTGQPEPAQFSRLTASTTAATLTIGGNDVGFTNVIQRCVFFRFAIFHVPVPLPPGEIGPGCASNAGLMTVVQARMAALAGRGSATTPRGTPIQSVLSLINAAHTAAPNAQIYVAGYPLLFGTFRGECGIGTGTLTVGRTRLNFALKITAPDAAFLNTLGTQLEGIISNAVVQARAAGVPVAFVDPSTFFAGHRLCDSSTSWIKPFSGTASLQSGSSFSMSFDSGSFHPTQDGQRQGYEAAFLATAIGLVTSGA
jgi:hypothetical protein